MGGDGGEVYWDNLYPSRDVAQAVAKGGEYKATYPAGPKVGEEISINVPKTGTCGTARTNRGIAPECKQPEKKGMSQKALDAIKAKPLKDRVKSAMTKSEPRVICVSVFDNGPVHLARSEVVAAHLQVDLQGVLRPGLRAVQARQEDRAHVALHVPREDRRGLRDRGVQLQEAEGRGSHRPEATLSTEEKHALLDKADAIANGYLGAKAKNHCAYKFCKHGAENKKQKCGQNSANMQEGRSRAPCFCAHPACMCGYHATCYSLAHHLLI